MAQEGLSPLTVHVAPRSFYLIYRPTVLGTSGGGSLVRFYSVYKSSVLGTKGVGFPCLFYHINRSPSLGTWGLIRCFLINRSSMVYGLERAVHGEGRGEDECCCIGYISSVLFTQKVTYSLLCRLRIVRSLTRSTGHLFSVHKPFQQI